RGRGHGRPDRCHQQWRNHSGRGQETADGPAWQEGIALAINAAFAGIARGAVGVSADVVRGWACVGLHLQQGIGRKYRAQSVGNAAPARRFRHRIEGPAFEGKLTGRHFREPGKERLMNLYGVKAIYKFEMARAFRTLMQSIASPVLSTALYLIVFGAAIGSRMGEIDGVSYGAFIVPGLLMMALLGQSISNASF